MIEIVHDDGRCIKGTPDAVIIAEREAAEYNPVAIANVILRSIQRKSRRIASRGLTLRLVMSEKLEFTVDIHILNTGIFKDSRFLRLT